jgi:hypothetical protein
MIIDKPDIKGVDFRLVVILVLFPKIEYIFFGGNRLKSNVFRVDIAAFRIPISEFVYMEVF